MNENKAGYRPLVTFAIFAYNQEVYIRDAIEGALSQTYSPIEFIFSDDCSSDLTYSIMEEYARSYKGLGKIRLNRNSRNLGVTAHLNAVNAMATGDIFVYAAGDDVSLPSRTSTVVKQFQEANGPSLIMSNAILFNNSGEELGPLNSGQTDIIREQNIHPLDIKLPGFNGCTVCVRREMVDQFSDLMPGLVAEDTILVRRAALLNGITYIPEILVRYRVHGTNISRRKIEGRKEYLLNMTKWLKDIDLQYRQLEIDIQTVSTLDKIDPTGKLEIYKRSNVRRMRIVNGNFLEGLLAICIEFAVLKDFSVFKEVSRIFAIKWFPTFMRYASP